MPFTKDFTTTTQKTAAGGGRQLPLPRHAEQLLQLLLLLDDHRAGWAALSTDSSDGFVYLEANHCTVKTIKAGYGTYADGSCHDVLNRLHLRRGRHGSIIAGEADVTFNDTNAKCGSYFALIHYVRRRQPRWAR